MTRRAPATLVPSLAGLAGLAVLAVLSLLAACAPPLKDPWGLAVIRGQATAPPDTPRTLQADLSLAAHAAGAIPLSARLYAEPGQRYRLDIFGLFTPVVATWAWEANAWRLVRHDTREVVTGTGTSFIPLPASGQPLVIPDVHAALGFLWGQPLPGFRRVGSGHADSTLPTPESGAGTGVGEKASGTGALPASEGPGDPEDPGNPDPPGQVAWTYGGKPWTARFDPATGLCLEASSPDMTLRYGRYERQGARAVPREIEVWIEDARVLTLSVRARRENPAWARDPFVLTIPPGYDSTAVR